MIYIYMFFWIRPPVRLMEYPYWIIFGMKYGLSDDGDRITLGAPSCKLSLTIVIYETFYKQYISTMR